MLLRRVPSHCLDHRLLLRRDSREGVVDVADVALAMLASILFIAAASQEMVAKIVVASEVLLLLLVGIISLEGEVRDVVLISFVTFVLGHVDVHLAVVVTPEKYLLLILFDGNRRRNSAIWTDFLVSLLLPGQASKRTTLRVLNLQRVREEQQDVWDKR